VYLNQQIMRIDSQTNNINKRVTYIKMIEIKVFLTRQIMRIAFLMVHKDIDHLIKKINY